MFNGGSLLHGCCEIQPGTAPEWWETTEFAKSGARFNLQFRDLLNISNTYEPHFGHAYYPLDQNASAI
jgi:hypothetical protein